ncbi:MAG: cyclodeaminase/cyclohydrolase family protein [Methylococcales bacterium]|nr:cyclodeaminase/cyclohydrolase family protein [Methylococcales bacterium]MCK5925374.1 cyclodeaminase/cyclohydrolase family protein [Methylococcales bacterium]
MEIKDTSIETFLAELASKSATPGGGSVAAMMGAQSAALTSMVCRLTVGKPAYQAVEKDMQALLTRSEKLQAELTLMIKEDVDVFNKIMGCYRLPKSTEDEKTKRSAQIQIVLKEATLVPLKCVKACVEAIELSRIAADKGSLAVISDAGVAVISAYAGLKSATLNVYINTKSIKDTQFTTEKLAELDALLKGTDETTQEIYQVVEKKL